MSTEKFNDGFNSGTIAALALVTVHDHQVLWREIVHAAGAQKIINHAWANEGDWEWAGFSKYAETEFGKKAIDAALGSARKEQPNDAT